QQQQQQQQQRDYSKSAPVSAVVSPAGDVGSKSFSVQNEADAENNGNAGTRSKILELWYKSQRQLMHGQLPKICKKYNVKLNKLDEFLANMPTENNNLGNANAKGKVDADVTIHIDSNANANANAKGKAKDYLNVNVFEIMKMNGSSRNGFDKYQPKINHIDGVPLHY
ncbi:hypothetical protein RFI_19756, partial [Reticulomyxa filosa]